MNAADGGFSAADTWANDISGTGGLIKRGTGILTLSGNNTFTGPITINGGGLNITGSVSGSSGLTANTGIVGGTGNLPATTINTGATHAPGNSIGTQTINGNYALNNATLAIEFQGPTSDRVNVTGNVTAFSGTALLAPYGGGQPWPSFNYTVVSAPNSPVFTGPNSLTLDSSLVTSALLRFGTQLQQEVDANLRTFDLRWQPLTAAGATTAAMQTLGNTNAQAMTVSGMIDRSIARLQVQANGNANAGGAVVGTSGFTQNQANAAGLSADYIQSVSDLIGLSSGAALTNAVNAIAPEPYAAFLSVGLDTLRQQRSNLLAQAGQCHAIGWVINPAKPTKATSTATKAKRPPLCVYAQAGNTTGVVNGSQGLDSYNSGIFSTGLGLETSLSKQWTLGLAYGYGSSYANNFSGANAFVNANVNGVSVYSVYRPDQRWAISSLLGYSNFTISGNRTIPGIGNGPLTGSTSANGVTAAVEATYLLPLTAPTASTQVLAKPLLGLAWGGYQQTGFSETGGGFSQSVQGRTANSLLGTVGVEFMTSPLALNAQRTTTITPRLSLAYQVDPLANNVQNKTVDSGFVGAPGAGSLSTEGQNLGVNNLNVAGGFTVQVADQVSVYASASYLLLSNANQFSYNGGVRVKF
jgi:autotransporter-associated beta strand protein